MSAEDDITAQLSTFLENDTDNDSDMDEIIDLSSKTENITVNTPKDENEDEEEEEDIVLDTSPDGNSTVLEATFEKSKKETENVSKLLSLPVKKFYSKSADNDDIGSSFNDWRKQLSNFYSYTDPISIDGMSWTTLEAWFQASKFMYNKDDPVYMNYIKKFQHEEEYGIDPKQSKKQGAKTASKKNKVVLDPNWDTLRNEVMFKGLVYKIVQKTNIRTILEKIKDTYFLLHHSTRDTYWGGSKKGDTEIKGKNVLGLMYTFLAHNLDKINIDSYKELYTKYNEMIDSYKEQETVPSTTAPYRIALTFGDAGENNVGMEMVGTLGEIGSGFTTEELQKAQQKLTEQDIVSEYHSFDKDEHTAGILIIRNVINKEEHVGLLKDMDTFKWDSKYFDTRQKKVLNKHARTNVVILDGIEQEPDYPNKKGRIVDTNTLETFKKFKKNMVSLINTATETNKADNLICEGNRYYNLKKCGIGYHGDRERRKVIALSLGESSTINWQWFQHSNPVGDTYKFTINGGDIYIMSEKAVGYDWRSPSKLTLRHAAGANKYTCLDKYSETPEDATILNKVVIKKNDYTGFDISNHTTLEHRFISLEEAYSNIEEIFSIKQSYNDFMEKNINRILKQQKGKKYTFTLDGKTFTNLLPEVYTTVKDNKVTYTCDIYNICNHEEKSMVIQQKIYSKQIIMPRMEYYSIAKKNINKTLQNKLLTIKLRSLLNKINLLQFLDIKEEEVDSVKESYKQLFNTIKKEYNHLDTLKSNVYEQYKQNVQTHKQDKENIEFIKNILTITYDLYYYYKKGKYHSIFYKEEDESDYLDIIYGNNIDLLQEDYSNKHSILRLEKIKKISTSSKIMYTLENKSSFDHSIENVSNHDIIAHLMYHSFTTVINKQTLYAKTEIMLIDNDNMEELYEIIKYGEEEVQAYENKNNVYGKMISVNREFVTGENILHIYIDAEKNTPVGSFVKEYINPEDVTVFSSLNNYSDWRSQLSNEYMSLFVVDGVCFNSVEHYLQYSKFKNREDIKDAISRRNHELFANRFTFSSEHKGLYSHISGKQAYIEGSSSRTKNYNIHISENWLDIRSKLLVRALTAKFYQHKDMLTILKKTGNAILISPFKGKNRKYKYRVNFELMTVRENVIDSTILDTYLTMEKDYQIYKLFTNSKYKNSIDIDFDYNLEDITTGDNEYTDEELEEDSDAEEEKVEPEEDEEEELSEEDEDEELSEEDEEEELSEEDIGDIDITIDEDDEELNIVTGQKPSTSVVDPETIKEVIQSHIKKRFLLLRSHLDDNANLTVVIAGNPNLIDVGPESAMYIKDAGEGEHKYFAARGHFLGVFRAHNQWKSIISDTDELKQIYVNVLQLIDREVDNLYTSYNDRISFSETLMRTPDTQANNDRYIVWGANVTNWNLDTGTKITGSGQASYMGTQQTGIFGIVTTPLDITSNNISTLLDIDNTHPEIVYSDEGDEGGAVATKESQPDPLSTVSDETIEKELVAMEGIEEEDLEEPDLFLQKFLTSELDTEFTKALTELQQGRKEGHWIWWFFPQAPLGKTSRSLQYSFENKRQVQDYVKHPKLFERFVLLLDTLLAYKQEHPDDTLLQIFAKNDSKREFTDKDKFLSSLTLFYKVLTQNNETIQQTLSTTTDISTRTELNKTFTSNKIIIDKIERCQELFGEEFVFDSQTETLLSMVIDDEVYFKETMEGSASFTGGGLDTTNTMNNYDHNIEKLKNIDTSILSNLENLKNLVGGKVNESILAIALQNNDNNVYSSLQSLLNPTTRGIYEILAKK